MFPTPAGDRSGANRSTLPSPLRTATWLSYGSAVVMLVTAMMMLASGFPKGAPEEAREVFMLNMRIVAWGNIALALLLVIAIAQIPVRMRRSRVWAAGFIAAAIFLNLVGFVMQVASWSAFVISVALIFAVFFLFRPDANAFMEQS